MTKINSALVERAESTLATGVAPDWDEFLEIQGLHGLAICIHSQDELEFIEKFFHYRAPYLWDKLLKRTKTDLWHKALSLNMNIFLHYTKDALDYTLVDKGISSVQHKIDCHIWHNTVVVMSGDLRDRIEEEVDDESLKVGTKVIMLDPKTKLGFPTVPTATRQKWFKERTILEIAAIDHESDVLPYFVRQAEYTGDEEDRDLLQGWVQPHMIRAVKNPEEGKEIMVLDM